MSPKYPEKALAWTDTETTGLDYTTDLLLEVAVLVTDVHLNLLDNDGYQAVVLHDPQTVTAARERAVPFVQQMHEETGLWDKVSDPRIAKPLDVIDTEVLAYLQRHIADPRTARLAGNSVRLDLNFIEVHLPQSYAFLHYRMGDMSSVAGAVQWWFEEDFYPKRKRHAAMDDIRESLAEARWLRERMHEGLVKRSDPMADWFAHRLLTDTVRDQLASAGHEVNTETMKWKSWTCGPDHLQVTAAMQGQRDQPGSFMVVFLESNLHAYGTPEDDWLWSQYGSGGINHRLLQQWGLTVVGADQPRPVGR